MDLLRFFYQILIGNFMSKLFLIIAEVLILFYLPNDQFGTFVFLQGLIISGSVISVWGADQAIINAAGRNSSKKHDISTYHHSSRVRIFWASIPISILAAVIAEFSNALIDNITLLLLTVIIVIEAQLILNSALLRAKSRAYLAVLYLDGFRHIFLLLVALIIILLDLNLTFIIFGWLFAAVISFVCGNIAIFGIFKEKLAQVRMADADGMHADTIAKFSGIWSFTQVVISRMIIILSGYFFTADELGTIAFFMKLMIIFTFLQTVMLQSIAPVIGKVSRVENIEDAKMIFKNTTIFLACVVAPAAGVCLLTLNPLMIFFGIEWNYSLTAVYALIFAQALNIGTGLIGQFIIHFGYAKNLLFISLFGALLQCVLFYLLATQFGMPGVLLSYAITSVFLVLSKNIFSRNRIGFDGLQFVNLGVIGFAIIMFFTFESLFDISTKAINFTAITLYIITSVFFVIWIIKIGTEIKISSILIKDKNNETR